VGVDAAASGRGALKWAAGYARSTGQPLRAMHVFSYSSEGAIAWSPADFRECPTAAPTS